MRFFKTFSSVQTRVIKLFANTNEPKKVHFYSTHLKPPKANQTLRRYLNSNSTHKVLSFFINLLRKSLSTIDSYSLLFVLKACTRNSTINGGKQVHAVTVKLGFEPIIFLQTSLVNMYSSAGIVEDAHRMFDEIPVKNIVCWTALISAYVDNQKPNKALQMFRRMQMDNVEPDQVTVTVALSACADLGALDMGEWIHAYVRRKHGLDVDVCLNNALINMYAKCGDIGTCRGLFDSVRKKDVTTWTSMIVGHALHGQAKEALELFEEMKKENKNSKKNKRKVDSGSSSITPNDVTFVGVLMACSHAGLVEEGKRHFKSMREDYGLKPRSSHFGCMVDLLCRAGLLKQAYDFILEMPIKPNAVVWRTLLGACSLNGNVELGAEVRCQLVELEPGHVVDDVIMSNIYASKGMWDKKMVVRNQIIKRRRPPGCSSIEVPGSGISEFVTADDDHPLSSQIYEVVKHLIITMKAYGYAPQAPSGLTEF